MTSDHRTGSLEFTSWCPDLTRERQEHLNAVVFLWIGDKGNECFGCLISWLNFLNTSLMCFHKEKSELQNIFDNNEGELMFCGFAQEHYGHPQRENLPWPKASSRFSAIRKENLQLSRQECDNSMSAPGRSRIAQSLLQLTKIKIDETCVGLVECSTVLTLARSFWAKWTAINASWSRCRAKRRLQFFLECGKTLGMVAAEARLHVAVLQVARTLFSIGANDPVEVQWRQRRSEQWRIRRLCCVDARRKSTRSCVSRSVVTVSQTGQYGSALIQRTSWNCEMLVDDKLQHPDDMTSISGNVTHSDRKPPQI